MGIVHGSQLKTWELYFRVAAGVDILPPTLPWVEIAAEYSLPCYYWDVSKRNSNRHAVSWFIDSYVFLIGVASAVNK